MLDARFLHELLSGTQEEVFHLANVGDQVLVAHDAVMSTKELRDGLWHVTDNETRH